MKIAFFDIDNTLAYGDSVVALIKYGIKKNPLYIFTLPVLGIAALLYGLKILPIEKMKNIAYLPLKHMDEKELNRFFDKYILGRKIEASFEKLLSLKSEGYYIILATASPISYMKLWQQRGYCHKIFATEVKANSNKIIGKNCSGKQKVVLIEEYLKSSNMEIDYESSFGFSDSDRDIPMLSLVKNRFRVLKDGSITEFIPKG